MKTEADSDGGSSKGSRRITIYDVARQAGVSPSTVSRTFSRPDRVSISTARMVQRVADSLGYHSDMVDSRSDSQGRGLVAVIVPDLGNQFFTGVIRNIQDECERFHFETLILDTRESITRERRIIDAVAPVVSGIILVSPRMPDAMIRKCAQLRPLVSVNRNVRGVSSISIDSSKGACQVIGFDNDIMSMVSSPPLTTIHMSLSALGRGAADLLMKRLSGAALSAVPTVPARLIIRQSTDKAASGS